MRRCLRLLELKAVVTERGVKDCEVPRIGTIRNRTSKQFKRKAVAAINEQRDFAISSLRANRFLHGTRAPIAVEARAHCRGETCGGRCGHRVHTAKDARDVRALIDLSARVACFERADDAGKRAWINTCTSQGSHESIEVIKIASLSSARERCHRHAVTIERVHHHHLWLILVHRREANRPLRQELIRIERGFSR